ncbi:MAG: TRAP transporter small permease subunit [Proteobacteria bacterium]|nr:TRAP transporter small permease subunit [Pseudomonadota bacterium]
MLVMLVAKIRAVECALVAVIMIAMSIMFFVNVAVRTLSPRLATELAWIEEATLFALAWLVFVGLGLALERRRHIAMTVILDRLPRWAIATIARLVNVTGLVFAAFLAKISFDLAIFIFQSGQISPTLGITMAGLYAPLPVGFSLLALRYLLELVGFQDRTAIAGAPAEH